MSGPEDTFADLYEGLDVAVQEPPEQAALRARAEAAEADKALLQKQKQALEQRTAVLSTQCLALKRNISCLYKTAKLEVDRKDAEIHRLREELESLKSGRH
eukprot:m.43091 g.43091  ORF g.43091 m.43091 type:complete len:101 (+) comp6134_c0_seq1:137-439(+)